MSESIEDLLARPCHQCDHFSSGWHPIDDRCGIHGQWADLCRMHFCQGRDFVPRERFAKQAGDVIEAWEAFLMESAKDMGLVRLLDWIAAKLKGTDR